MTRSNDSIKSLRFPEYLSGGAFLCDPISRHTPCPSHDIGETITENADLSIFERGLARVVHAGLGQGVRHVAYPGGIGRASCILTLDDARRIVATLRDEPARTALEFHTLSTLHAKGGPCPEPLYFNGMTLLQEYLPGERVAERIQRTPDDAWSILAGTLDSLANLHERGSAAGLDDSGPILGASLDWHEALFARPNVLGKWSGIAAPKCNLDRQIDLLTCYAPRFVKWDARGGNAMRAEDGHIGWFDFEHCGARNRLDDLVWLLADETVPDDPVAEEVLLDIAIDRFADGRSADEARAYVYCMGTFHAAVRLGIILHRKSEDDWQEPEDALAEDKLPLSLGHMRVLARRGARWADKGEATRPLSAWWRRIEHFLINHDRKIAGRGKSKQQSLR